MQVVAGAIADFGSSRLNRLLLVMAGLVAYALFCLALARFGYLHVAGSDFNLLVGIWAAGLLGLMLADSTRGRFDAGALTLAKALWCNVGIVLTALLIPHAIRLLLLMVPLISLVYAALHLNRTQMLGIGLATWLTYIAGVVWMLVLGGSDARFEGLTAAAFTCMMVGMMYIASEVTALRVAFDVRRQRLNEVMEQLSEQAMCDELTGLYNRRYIMEVLARQKALADRGQPGFTLCYCDLDHFKRINDCYGHQRGDQALSNFARVAEGVVRSVDFVARLGGEEFLLVLIGTDAATAEKVASRLCERTRKMAVMPETPDYRLTVSVGIAGYVPTERVEDVIQRADRALYSAKSQGRDRIVLGS